MSEADDETEAPESSLSRRAFLALSAATSALAACSRAPRGKIVPAPTEPGLARASEEIRYATAHEVDGYGMGLVAKSRAGRPFKVEGNPAHPSSLGATRAFDQSLVSSLFDPRRARAVRAGGEPSTWQAFVSDIRMRRARGERIAMLLPRTSSPTIEGLVRDARDVGIYFHSPLEPRRLWGATKLAYGSALEPRLRLEHARVVLAVGADFLESGPAALRDARAWAKARRAEDAADVPRLYAVEARWTATGAAADHRLAAKHADHGAIARALAKALSTGASAPASPIDAALGDADELPAAWQAFVRACAGDLARAGKAGLVVADPSAPPELQALAWAMNERLGSGAIEWIRSPVLEAGNDDRGIDALMDRLHAGDVDALVVAGVDAASCLSSRAFEAALSVVPFTAYAGLYEDRTARASQWFVPLAHPLESWADTRAHDGTMSLAQPLIEPLFDGRTIAELVHAVTSDDPPLDAHILASRAFARAGGKAKDGDAMAGKEADDWERALATGVVEGTSFRAERVQWKADDVARALGRGGGGAGPLELALHADPAVHDGRFATSPMLLELPEPFTKVAWTNTATMSGATAAAVHVSTGDVVTIAANGREIDLPVFVLDGVADGVIAVGLGWGLGAVGDDLGKAGADAYALQKDPGDAVLGCTVTATGRKALLPRAQLHMSLAGREHEIFRTRHAGEPAEAPEPRRLTLYDAPAPTGRAWGMTIELGACLGCNACVAACQAENNVPVVGPHGVDQGRIMHWLRIDRYDVQDGDAHVVALMPMLCQQCEKAPCEYVCPVEATTHSRDGLNDMVYNRCVGTRFCSNNCPYKVRRFNWFDYHQHDGPLEALGKNPEVTVRARGVMEKCTFCVQRIREAEHAAGVQGRALGRDEFTTACAEACPTEAIVFGDLADPGSRVVETRKDASVYSALGELGTEPRVKYVPRLRNPNPELG